MEYYLEVYCAVGNYLSVSTLDEFEISSLLFVCHPHISQKLRAVFFVCQYRDRIGYCAVPELYIVTRNSWVILRSNDNSRHII